MNSHLVTMYQGLMVPAQPPLMLPSLLASRQMLLTPQIPFEFLLPRTHPGNNGIYQLPWESLLRDFEMDICVQMVYWIVCQGILSGREGGM